MYISKRRDYKRSYTINCDVCGREMLPSDRSIEVPLTTYPNGNPKTAMGVSGSYWDNLGNDSDNVCRRCLVDALRIIIEAEDKVQYAWENIGKKDE